MSKNGWTLLTETRRKCWRGWWYGAAPIILLTLVQTISPRLKGIEAEAWLWAGINIMPGLAMIFVSVIRYQLPQKIISTGTHKGIWGGTWGYILLLYLTVISEVQVMNNGGALKDYLLLSFAWLAPAQSILLTGYYLTFFSKLQIARPDNRNVLELAAQKSQDPKLSAESRACFEQIAAANLAEAFRLANLSAQSLPEQAQSNLLVLSGSYERIGQKVTEEEMDIGDAQRQLNRLSIGLMNIAEEL